MAGFGGVAVEAFVLDAGGWVVSGGGFVGLLPVALAVPEVAGLVVVPEGVVLGPDAVVELFVLFAAVDGTGGEPFDVGHELAVLGGVPGCPLFGCAGSSDGGVVFGRLPGVVFLDPEAGILNVTVGSCLKYVLCGMVGFVGCEA